MTFLAAEIANEDLFLLLRGRIGDGQVELGTEREEQTEWSVGQQARRQTEGKEKATQLFKLAAGAFGTESEEVVLANDLLDVPVLAVGSVAAKASIIPRTVFDLGLSIEMQKLAFLVTALAWTKRDQDRLGQSDDQYELEWTVGSGTGLTVFGVEEALGHLAHVVFVQELALVALLAQTSEPMLAYDGLVAWKENQRERCISERP